MSGYEWGWLEESEPSGFDTIEAGSRIVVYGTVPQPFIVRGVTVWIYDPELTIMIIRQWFEQGMTRREVEELLLERIPQ